MSMMPKRHARSDPNHVVLSRALRLCGWEVEPTKTPTDAIIVKPGRHMLLVEFKRDAKSKFTEKQIDLITRGFPVVRLETIADVERLTRG